MNDSLSLVRHSEICQPKSLDVFFEGDALQSRVCLLDKGGSALEILSRLGGNVVVDCHKCAVLSPYRSLGHGQTFESLGRCDFMDNVSVAIERRLHVENGSLRFYGLSSKSLPINEE